MNNIKEKRKNEDIVEEKVSLRRKEGDYEEENSK